MSVIVESPLAYSRPIKSKLHVINGGSPAIHLSGGQWSTLEVLRDVTRLNFFAPETLILGLLAVAPILFVGFHLVVNINLLLLFIFVLLEASLILE